MSIWNRWYFGELHPLLYMYIVDPNGEEILEIITNYKSYNTDNGALVVHLTRFAGAICHNQQAAIYLGQSLSKQLVWGTGVLQV